LGKKGKRFVLIGRMPDRRMGRRPPLISCKARGGVQARQTLPEIRTIRKGGGHSTTQKKNPKKKKRPSPEKILIPSVWAPYLAKKRDKKTSHLEKKKKRNIGFVWKGKKKENR